MPSRLSVHMLLAGLGTVAYAASQWLQLVVIARLGSVEEVGRFALALAITAPVFMLGNMRLRFIVATSTSNGSHLSDYLSTRMATTASATLAAFAVGALFFRGTQMFWPLVLVAIIKAVEALSDLCQGVFQKYERIDLFASSQSVSAAALLGACYLGINRFGTLEAGLALMVVARCATFITFDLRKISALRREKRFALHPFAPSGRLSAVIRVAFPLGIVALLVSLNASIPRYFVRALTSEFDLGIYAALAYIPVAGYMVVGAFGQAAMQSMAAALHGSDRGGLLRVLGMLSAIGFCGGAGATLLCIAYGRQILGVIYGPEFADFSGLLALLMVSGTLSYVVIQFIYLLTALRRNKVQLVVYSVDALLLSLLCWILIPEVGLEGAALAGIASQAVQLAIVLAVTWRLIARLPKSKGLAEAKL